MTSFREKLAAKLRNPEFAKHYWRELDTAERLIVEARKKEEDNQE